MPGHPPIARRHDWADATAQARRQAPWMSRGRSSLASLRDRHADGVAPLGPAAIVVPNLGIPEQVGEDEPGVRRALADAAVRDHVVSPLQALLPLIDRAQLLGGPEGPIGVRRARPRDVLRARDVAAAHGTLLGVLRHVQLPAGELVRRAYVDHRLSFP